MFCGRCIRGDGGKCEWTGAPFYKDLTYEHTMEMYDRFYRFDNALILLYGDLDWKRFLAFLDKEYLCDAKKSYGKEDGWSFQSGSGRQEKQEMQNIGMSAFYSPESDGLENGENHSSVRQPFPVLLTGETHRRMRRWYRMRWI